MNGILSFSFDPLTEKFDRLKQVNDSFIHESAVIVGLKSHSDWNAMVIGGCYDTYEPSIKTQFVKFDS